MRTIYPLVAIIQLACSVFANPPELSGTGTSQSLPGPGEKIRLYTDRNLYGVNEKIYFTTAYSCFLEDGHTNWSNVLYVELINWKGFKLSQVKLKMQESGSSGYISIPENTRSGTYYIRAYTKWMRNFPVNEYAYQAIRIVNPFDSGLDSGPDEMAVPQETPLILPVQQPSIQGMQCKLDKTEYKPGEKATVEIFLPEKQYSDCESYCVSVAKAGLIDTTFSGFEHAATGTTGEPFRMEYLPEIRGITISGTMMDPITHSPGRNIPVSLSIPLNGAYFAVCRTNDQGRFVFSLSDLYGSHDFFIQAETRDTLSSEIFIDQGFCNKPVALPYIPFILSEEEKILVREMVINQQLSEKFAYAENPAGSSQIRDPEPVVFYGSDRASYRTKDYIELPNLEEFFIEIVREIIVKYDKGKPTLKNARRTSFASYSPLVLMDNIPVANDERLLTIPLNRIERVEAIGQGYMVGDMKYDGLVSIYSRNKDFAGIDLREHSMFFTYEVYPEESPEHAPPAPPEDPRIPDRRNLLYWNPDLKLTAGQKTVFSFHTSDIKGEYVVFVRGKSNTADAGIYGQYHFSVR